MGNADNGAVGTATDPPSSATPAKKIKKSSAAASNKSNKKHAGSGANGTRLSSHLMQDSSTTSCSSSSTSSTAEDDNSNNNATTVISSADRMLLTFMDSDSEEATKTHTATGFLHRSYRSQAAGNTRRVTPQPQQQSGDGKLVLVEKALPNGDIYSGYFSAGGHVPHGTGKYLWADGCMYEGEWRRGKAAGKGKFSWPSGATFEGHFRSGRMEGYGTFTGPEGDTYRGDWVADRKHGKGEKRYANGDFYEGEWRRNLQEGQGRYVWRNGNQYVGEWKNGLISGRGVLIWANGNRYDGQWEDGVPKGSGVFTWPDGSCYVVSSLPSSAQPDDLKPDHFVHGLPQLHGTFYPSTTPANAINHTNPSAVSSPFMPPSIPPNNNRWTNHFLPQASQSSVYPLPPDSPTTTNTNHRLSSPGKCMPPESFQGRGSHAAGSEKTFPRICIWESDGAAGDITCDIIDTVEASMLYKDGVGSKIVTAAAAAVGFQQGAQTPPCKSPRAFIGTEVKKPGQAISKGHRHYDLMRNLQLGISYSVGKPLSSGDMRDLKQSDFNPKEKYWTKFPPEGSKTTPPHQSSDFRWKDYCPRVFRHLRKLFAIDPADYMLAICGNEALRELSSPGKSGSFFYLTQDDRFMIKTVKKSEVKVLIRMLPSYYAHVSQHKNTLVTKFFGVHCVKPVGGQKVRFTVMGNVFCSEYRIHRRFDLKGSSHGRTVQKPDGDIDETTTLKDLDLNFVFRLQQSWFQDLISQINRDCEFLERERIMDYSLLIGLHFRDDVSASNNGRSSTASPGYHPFADGLPDTRKPVARLGAGMPARAELILRNELDCYVSSRGSGAPRQRSEVYDVVLYFGIIDILQDYDISKKLEHAYKSLQVDPCSISAVDPRLYSKRFREFIGRVFVEDR